MYKLDGVILLLVVVLESRLESESVVVSEESVSLVLVCPLKQLAAALLFYVCHHFCKTALSLAIADTLTESIAHTQTFHSTHTHLICCCKHFAGIKPPL